MKDLSLCYPPEQDLFNYSLSVVWFPNMADHSLHCQVPRLTPQLLHGAIHVLLLATTHHHLGSLLR